MRYRLAVLTHGRSDPLERTLASFLERVRPLPSSVSVFADGSGSPNYAADAFAGAIPEPYPPFVLTGEGYRELRTSRFPFPMTITHPASQLGFCDATRTLWNESTMAPEEYVFWLEHDFLFTRDVDLVPMGQLLSLNEGVAQVALVRNPVNDAEVAAGGLIEARPGEFEREMFWRNVATDYLEGGNAFAWLRHRSFFTTNPSLMRRSFMAENPWPGYQSECEGRFGIDLVERGFSFAFWGAGEPWVEHFGVRDGVGY